MKDRKAASSTSARRPLEGARSLLLQQTDTRDSCRSSGAPRRHRDGDRQHEKERCSSRTPSSSSISRASTSSSPTTRTSWCCGSIQGELSAARGHAPHRAGRRQIFGPYHSATSCRATLAVVNRHFKLPPAPITCSTRASGRACNIRSSAATRPASIRSPTRVRQAGAGRRPLPRRQTTSS